MARGRMLNKSISASVKFDLLPDDTCRLMASWTIAHLDKNGVFYGDPVMVKSFVFPRRADVTTEQVEHYLSEMQRVGLIHLFKARGQLWQYWPGFVDNQVGLRADREGTEYPDPPDFLMPEEDQPETAEPEGDSGNLPDDSRNDAGNLPESIPPKINRSKRKRKNSKEAEKSAPTPLNQEMFGVLAQICSINWQICSADKRGELNQVEKILRVGARASPDDLKEFRLWWDEYDWRGKKRGNGDPPTPSQVRDEWQKFIDWRQGKVTGEIPENGSSPPDGVRNSDGSYNF
jgi:hypothetical protein